MQRISLLAPLIAMTWLLMGVAASADTAALYFPGDPIETVERPLQK